MYQFSAFFVSLYCCAALHAFGPRPYAPAEAGPPAPLPSGVSQETVDAITDKYGLETPEPPSPFQQVVEAYRNADWGWSLSPST